VEALSCNKDEHQPADQLYLWYTIASELN